MWSDVMQVAPNNLPELKTWANLLTIKKSSIVFIVWGGGGVQNDFISKLIYQNQCFIVHKSSPQMLVLFQQTNAT